MDSLRSKLSEQQKQIDEQKSQLASLTRKNSASSALKSPPILNSPIGSWRAEASSSTNTVQAASVPSPQYPRRQSYSKPLLQPSKLDNAIKQRQEQRLQSNSVVTAIPKQFPLLPHHDLPQPVAQRMQYSYIPASVADNHSLRTNATYLQQQLQPTDHVTNFGPIAGNGLTTPQEFFSQITSVCPSVENADPSAHIYNQLALANTHSHLQYL